YRDLINPLCSNRVNEDLRRYPRRVLEAYCLCEGCLVDRQEDRSVQSEPFYQEVPVLPFANLVSSCGGRDLGYSQVGLAVFQLCRVLLSQRGPAAHGVLQGSLRLTPFLMQAERGPAHKVTGPGQDAPS
uniref:Uncharacterized protein n=1 Tax=Gopherus evgoodei TaxID=1825980 RepID=A0A8C4WMF8_9SAUR